MSSWLTSALQTFRDKSADALDFVRRDLTEFTTTVKTDTESYLNKISSQQVGDLGINQFVSKISGSAKTENDSGQQHAQAKPSFDRVHNEVSRMQNEESTYLSDPTSIEAYEAWREKTNFNVETRKGDIAQLLIDAPHVRSFYARLVPAQTTHNDFWSRYYYRLYLIEEEEARRTQLLRRAHEICSEKVDNNEENNENDWDEPEEDYPKESTSVNQESAQACAVPIEQTEEPSQKQAPVEQKSTDDEPISSKLKDSAQETTHLDEANSERVESDTISGDSWEREFDETDLTPSSISLKSQESPSEKVETKNMETVPTPTPIAATTTMEQVPSSSNLKTKNEFDDEWEAWS